MSFKAWRTCVSRLCSHRERNLNKRIFDLVGVISFWLGGWSWRTPTNPASQTLRSSCGHLGLVQKDPWELVLRQLSEVLEANEDARPSWSGHRSIPSLYVFLPRPFGWLIQLLSEKKLNHCPCHNEIRHLEIHFSTTSCREKQARNDSCYRKRVKRNRTKC